MDVNNFNTLKIAEYDLSGNEINISDTISFPILRGIIQNSLDSTYQLFFANSSVIKLDKNLQIVDSNHYIREENSSRWFQLPYFKSRIEENPVLSGLLLATNVGDSLCIASARLSSDSTVRCNWKKLALYGPITINSNNYVYNWLYNEDKYENNLFYAYQKKQCLPGVTNCFSKFFVVKHDTMNNTIWELEFGNDAGYSISKVLALRNSGCVVFVQRTRTDGNIDLYYVCIDKDGNVVNNFLPLLGGEELAIPVKVVFTLYPNPTNNYLSLDNTSLEKTAKHITVFDVNGKVVLKQPFEKTIDVSGLDQGTYIYRIEMESGLYYDSKFVKR